MANRYDDRSRRRVRRFTEERQDTLNRRIERRFDAMVEAYDSGDYAEIVKQAALLLRRLNRVRSCRIGNEWAGRMGYQ